MPVLIGTSGWQYRHWRETFYPRGVRQADWLAYFAARFATVEVNNAFYRLPEAATFARWARCTPEDFVVAVKASRFLTHVRRLREPEGPVRLLLERARSLGSKLGPVLLQLPPDLRADLDRLDATLAAFDPGVRVAVEFRHPSWFSAEARALLESRGAALCLADRMGVASPLWRTADWGYLRMHEGRARPHPCYGRDSRERWARRLAELWGPEADVFAYFNNDGCACALHDARLFAAAAERAGLRPTRVPAARDVRLC
ncbi:MAG: hypothetical protein QOK40_2368 [Miltoncostaeaceae bacterium]|nr:hypothetical protein [Miltoncostaeaceae bacterium]